MTIFVFGEAMLEYHSQGGEGLRYGGDTLNTAIHLARLGQDVAYVTAVGCDPISDALVAAWEAEGIDTRHVHRHPDRGPGIYAIHLDAAGERSFLYWRDCSAARDMFALPGMADTLVEARNSELIYFSLITLAVIGEAGRDALFDTAQAHRSAGAPVAYDSNYRPALWSRRQAAIEISNEAMKIANIGLPTDTDEGLLSLKAESLPEIAVRWHEAGCTSVIVKAGAQGCFYSAAGHSFARPGVPTEVVDTSGAGDAFNAGYLDAHLRGSDALAAVDAAQSLASATLQHHGAISSRVHPRSDTQ